MNDAIAHPRHHGQGRLQLPLTGICAVVPATLAALVLPGTANADTIVTSNRARPGGPNPYVL